MPIDGYNENDVVRVTRALRGDNPYGGGSVFVPSGQQGTIIVGEPGDRAYDVEFTLDSPGSTYGIKNAVLTVAAEDLELVERWS